VGIWRFYNGFEETDALGTKTRAEVHPIISIGTCLLGQFRMVALAIHHPSQNMLHLFFATK
jgi:hypothetical protein